MASTTKTTTEKLPDYYYQWDADNRFPELKRALANHTANLQRLQALVEELSAAQHHVDDHVYAIRVLDRLHDDFCYGAEAAGKKVNKFMKTYCGVYDADEFVSYELLRSIDALKEVQRKNCRKVVELEDNFIDLAFEMGPMQGLTAQEVKDYIRFIGNRRLSQLGLEPIYKVDKNPLTWLDTMLNAVEHMNFFEGRATEYSKASTRGNWTEAFS